MEEALERLRQLNGELAAGTSDPERVPLSERARVEHDLAWALQNLGHTEEALALRESPLREHLGPEAKAIGLANLARTMHRLGREDEAEVLYHDAIVLLSEVYGADSPRVGLVKGNLGSFHYGAGRLVEAEAALREAVELLEGSLDPAHPLLGVYLSSYSGVLANQGRLADAEPLNVRAVEILTAVRGPSHEDTISALNNLAFLHSDLGQWSDAAREYAAVAEAFAATDGETFWRTVLSNAYAGECFVLAGDVETGAALLHAALGAAHATFGASDVTDSVVRAGERAFVAPEHAAQLERWRSACASPAGDGAVSGSNDFEQ